MACLLRGFHRFDYSFIHRQHRNLKKDPHEEIYRNLQFAWRAFGVDIGRIFLLDLAKKLFHNGADGSIFLVLGR